MLRDGINPLDAATVAIEKALLEIASLRDDTKGHATDPKLQAAAATLAHVVKTLRAG